MPAAPLTYLSNWPPTHSGGQKFIMSHVIYKNCIEACDACVTACENCSSACLEEPEVKLMARCIALDRDCADICCVAARFMARGSAYAMELCALCAEVCQACCDECKTHQNEHCQNCAEACQKCADACRKMAKN